MEKNNPLYKDQGIHAIVSIFTVENGVVQVLLIKRKNEPYKDMWGLVGGAIYNNEDLLDGVFREIKEKTELKELDIYFSAIHGKKDRSPVMRMLATSFIGIIDYKSAVSTKEKTNGLHTQWFDIATLPNLAYDHNEIVEHSLNTLKTLINTTDILKNLFKGGFTLPELQKVFETITEELYDRRNFRKKLISSGIITPTNKTRTFEGKKPAIVYKFKNVKKNKSVF